MDSFALKLALSFVIGGIWITLATVSAEKFGGKAGGFLGGLPSTIVVAYLFIGLTQGPQQVHDTITAFPLAFSANSAYMAAFAVLAKRSAGLGIAGALFAWFALESIVAAVGVDSFAVSVGVWAAALVISYWIIDRRLGSHSQQRAAIRYTPAQIVLRAAFAGAVVSFAVVMSAVGGPVLGAVFASFPAIYTTTLVITSRSAGVEFARSVVKPLLVSSHVHCVVFAVALRYTVLGVGIVPAVAIAYVASVGSAFLTYWFIKYRIA